MLYILSGHVTETTVGGRTQIKPVRYVVPLKHLRITGDYITYGGIPIETTSLIRLDDEVAGDASYVDFVTRVSDTTRSIASTVIAERRGADVVERFQAEANVLVKEFKMSIATKGAVDVDNLRTRLYAIYRAYQ